MKGDKEVFKKVKPEHHTKDHRDKITTAAVWVEPIYRRQDAETDNEYKLFLIYRDLPWMDRSLKLATSVATNTPEKEVKFSHSSIVAASIKWKWKMRSEAYDLFIQEHNSEREERIRMEIKSKVERLCLNLTNKIERIEKVENANDLTEPEILRDMAVVQVMVGKDVSPAKFLLEAYKTIVGQKVVGGGQALRRLPELEWSA